MDEEEECEMMELEFEDGYEDENEKVEFDINIIIKQLEMQPTVEVQYMTSNYTILVFRCILTIIFSVL